MKSIWTSLVLGAALTLAGCGGGGGGGGDGGSVVKAPEPPPLSTAVQVSNLRPQRIDVQAVETEQSLYGVQLTADVVGDLSRLTGQTLYVTIEDPSQLYEVSTVEISPNGLNNNVFLKSKSTIGRAGTLEGTLKVNVCTDTACKSPLGNSPLSIPYKWTIAGAVRIKEAPSITVEVPFGTVAYQDSREVHAIHRSLTLISPADFVGGNLSFDWTKLGTQTQAMIANVQYDSPVAGQSTAATLMFPPAPVGTYSSKLTLSSPTRTTTFGQSVVEVNYVVKDSGQRMLYAPATVSARESAAETLRVVAADGTLYSRVSRIVYSSNSGAVNWLRVPNVSGSYSSLLSMSTEFTVFANKCGAVEPQTTCLGTGNYTATVYFATEAGIEAPVAFPVSLQVL